MVGPRSLDPGHCELASHNCVAVAARVLRCCRETQRMAGCGAGQQVLSLLLLLLLLPLAPALQDAGSAYTDGTAGAQPAAALSTGPPQPPPAAATAAAAAAAPKPNIVILFVDGGWPHADTLLPLLYFRPTRRPTAGGLIQHEQCTHWCLVQPMVYNFVQPCCGW